MTIKTINWQSWISVVGPISIAILYLWINSYFTTDEDFETYKQLMKDEITTMKKDIQDCKTELETDNVQMINLINDVKDVADRQEKKVKQLNKLSEEVNDIENGYIEIKTEVKYLHK